MRRKDVSCVFQYVSSRDSWCVMRRFAVALKEDASKHLPRQRNECGGKSLDKRKSHEVFNEKWRVR